MLLFDTDIIIWIQRGNTCAAALFDATAERCISVQSYMELLQCAQNRQQLQLTKRFLADFNVKILPFSASIGRRAAVYIEEYGLATGLRAGDALVAATAIEHNLPLSSSNEKHFRKIAGLDLRVFEP
jgi:predicted nucleic acid-binding protein